MAYNQTMKRVARCEGCLAEFTYDTYPSWAARKYCSRKCANHSTKNWAKIDRSKLDVSHLKNYQFVTGQKPWNDGVTGYKLAEHNRTVSQASINALKNYWADKPRPTDENHPSWKGDAVKYQALHQWVSKHRGKATTCVYRDCRGNSSHYEWANISGEYRRDLNDFVQLCKSCHARYDRGLIEL